MANKTIKPSQLGEEIMDQLDLYHQDIIDAMKAETTNSMKSLVKKTKAQKYKRDSGKFRRAITSRKLRETDKMLIEEWYVRAPHYRLAHLLEHGHLTAKGNRTVAYGFIGSATEEVTQEYLKNLKEAIKNGK